MGSSSGQDDANQWHGQRIVGERELSFHSDAEAKRRRRRRQNLVFGVLAALLAVVFVAALAVFHGRIPVPGQVPAASQTLSPAQIEDSRCPGQDFDYLDPSTVRVRVLNTTNEAGLAGRTAQKLEKRGFVITSTTSGASDFQDGVGAVVAGPKGYAQALTLQRHVQGAVFVFDETKRDDRVDLEVGAKFQELTKTRRLSEDPGKLLCAEPPASDK